MIVVDTNVMVHLLLGPGTGEGGGGGPGGDAGHEFGIGVGAHTEPEEAVKPAAGSTIAPGDAAARLLLTDPEWTAPTILMSELRNVLAGLLRRGGLELSDAAAICDDAEAILGDRVVTVPASPVLEVAIEAGLSAYDAEFVVLARRLGLTLVTGDRAILEGAPDVAVALVA